MTKEENIATLNEHLDHWKRLLSEKICNQSEGEKTIDALQNAIKALEQEPCEVSQGLVKDSQGFSQEPCDDAISRSAVLDLPRIKTHNVFGNVIYESVDVENVRRLPSVTPQPKMGKWEWIFDVSEETPVSPEEIEYAGWGCSICHNPPDDICDWDDPNDPPTHKYCPNCGADMRGDANVNDK